MLRFLIVLFLLSTILYNPAILIADGTITDLNNKIAEYTKTLEELSKSKGTLANQISILNSQVSLTLLKISQTEASVKITETEIIDLSGKINQLDISLNELSSQYISEVVQNYKLSKKYPQLIIFLTSDFNQFWQQYKYISTIQKNSQNSLINMETVRLNFETQKHQKQQKQQELETLNKRLAEQKTNLTKQKQTKDNLLAVTKNNEAKYQQLKRAAEDELNSLLKAKFVGKRSVKKGDPLGTMGNTGYSFGDHLHFGLYNLSEANINQWSYQNDTEPMDYLKQHTWPMNDPISITQGRGNTKYSYLYADRFHHGIDLVAPNKTVKAVNDGTAYFYKNPSSSLGNHVKLFHPDGKMSLYLHLQ